MYGNRVVVTGLGCISPIGLSVDEYWQNLLAGVSGAGRITTFDPEGLPVQIAAEVKGFDPGDYMDRKAARRMERFAQFSIAAAGQALADAGLEVNDSNAWDIGAIIATGGGGIRAVADEMETLVTRGWERVGPMMVPLMIPNMASCQVSMTYGIKGPVVTNTAACAAGVYSMFESLHFLRRGDVAAVVAGGTESAVLPLAFISMARTGALSRRNDDPQTASRPFDRDRDGFVFGEGAARATRGSTPSCAAAVSRVTPSTSARPSRAVRAPDARSRRRSRTPILDPTRSTTCAPTARAHR